MIPRPEAGPGEVLVQLLATGIVPNLRTILSQAPARYPQLRTPPLPAVLGPDAVGRVIRFGPRVSTDLRVGDRVYVNPGLSCGDCPACRIGNAVRCSSYTLRGFFGFGPGSLRLFDAYPHAGFGQFLTAPAENLTAIADRMSNEQAVRLGGLASSYKALAHAGFSAGDGVLVEDGTGTLGVCAVLMALALGAASVYATGHCNQLLGRLRAIDAARVVPIDLSQTSAQHALAALARAGRTVRLGGLLDTIAPLPCAQANGPPPFAGPLWFEHRDLRAVMKLVQAGRLNLDVLEHERFSLDQINAALDAHEQGSGGFTNLVLTH